MYSVHSRFLVHRSQLFFPYLPYFVLQALILYSVLGPRYYCETLKLLHCTDC